MVDDIPIKTALAENIRRLRLLRGWSQDELAARAGVSSVAMVEAGRRPNARLKTTVEPIAKALGVPVASLYQEGLWDPSPELLAFLASPIGRDVSDEERGLLMWLRIPGHDHTQQSYALLLSAIRASKKNL